LRIADCGFEFNPQSAIRNSQLQGGRGACRKVKAKSCPVGIHAIIPSFKEHCRETL
jgi:hypothetical protein